MTFKANLPPLSTRPARWSLAKLSLFAWGLASVWEAGAAGTWMPLANPAPGIVNNMLLLSDGTVIAASQPPAPNVTNVWFRLTPDVQGSYANGTWSAMAPMRDTRQYYSSAVLRDGRVFVAGGEYGSGAAAAEVYEPLSDTWTSVPPSGQVFSDSISKILPNGNILVSPVFPSTCGGTVIYNAGANTWSAGPSLFVGCYQAEASWVKLADNSILTVDPFGTNSERYIPSFNQWVNDAVLPVSLYDTNGELGAGLLLPNGYALFLGGTGHTAIYAPSGSASPGTWTAGPDIAGGQGASDAPAAMMVNGKILCAVGPANTYNAPTSFYEYDPTANSFTQVGGPTGLTDNVQPFGTMMLDLPDGTVLYSHFGTDLYVYQPDGSPLAAGKPAISSITRNADGSYHLAGTGLNGISEGAAYGDDAQMNSNFPLVRMTNSVGNVYYARTYNWSRTGVMTGNTPVTTEFSVPANVPAGVYSLVVVANGNSSDPVSFTADALRITPPNGVAASGPPGGPFSLVAQTYFLTNAGAAPLNWSLSNTSSWLNASSAGGTLTSGGPAAGVTFTLNAAAANLASGAHSATVWFTNRSTALAQSREFTLTVTALLAVQPYFNTVMSFGPVGYWRLNETNQPPAATVVATNLGNLGPAGNGANDGLLAWEAGALAGSADTCTFFTGLSYVAVPFTSGLSLNPPFTVEAWVKPAVAQTSGNFACVLSCGHFASPRSGWLVYQSPTGWNFRMYNQNGLNTSLNLETGGAPVPGTWYHVAAVYDGSNGYIYVNGVGLSGTPTGFVSNTDGALTIGARNDNNFYFTGAIDEVAVYTTVLPAATLRARYQNGTNSQPVTPYDQLVLSSNPIVYLRLDAPPTLPVALNSGSLATNANGLYEPGSVPGQPGVPSDGLGANNYACQFNGFAGFLYVPGTFLNLTGRMTLLAWVQPSPANGLFQTIAGKGDTSFRLSLDGSGYPHLADGQSNPDVVGASRIDDGVWHQLAGTYDGSSAAALYVDGLLAASSSAGAPVAGNNGDFWIGGAPDYSTTRTFNGVVDEVALFTNVLSAAQIQQIYSSVTNVPASSAPPPAFQSVTQSGGTLGLFWRATPGLRYQIQYKTNLTQVTWSNFGGIIFATNSAITTSDSVRADPQRFYRVTVLP